MELRILHLYHDLLNLYGEVGNVKILAKNLMKQNIQVTVKSSSVGDEIEFSDYDFIYLGSGTEKNQLVALNDLSPFTNELRDAIDQGVVVLATGNSFEIFGQYIRETDGKIYDGLNLFNFHAERSKVRTSADIIYSADFLEKNIVGFVNKKSMAYDIDNYLFKVKFGVGANENSNVEGIRENNFFGTYIIGPILVRNPHFLDYISRLICHAKDPNFEFKEIKNENQVKAFETALFELSKRMG
ncbi:MAG: glutamine amidotransferase [Firmicutes bacterium]|nr:glutamine amidotransferase [Bacillota bacterium]